MKSNFIFFAIFCFIFSSCEKEESSSTSKLVNSKGVYVVNEGNYGTGNSEISLILPDSSKVYNNIFSSANSSEPLGDDAQSMAKYDSLYYYVVVSTSNKVEVVNQMDFKRVAKIEGFELPRFMVFSNGKGYVSQWGIKGVDGSVAVVNLTSKLIEKTIKTGMGSEKMLVLNNNLYVANGGGYDTDSTMSIINTTTDQISKTIVVGYNPTCILSDKNNKIWLLCGGSWDGKIGGSLVCVNPANNTIELSLSFNGDFGQPSRLSLNVAKDKLLYIFDRKVFEMSINDKTLPVSPKLLRGFYNIGVDPSNGIIYCTDDKSGKTNGYVIRYSASYALIDSFKVGFYPSEIFFNN